MQRKIYLTVILLFAGAVFLKAQLQINKAALQTTADKHSLIENSEHNKAFQLAKQKSWRISYKTKNGGLVSLIRTNTLGKPMYLATHDNIIAAATTGASMLWPNGSSGLNLNGSTIAKGKLAMWDGGSPLTTHVELTGRIKVGDTTVTPIDHSTHVAGTLIASGVNPVVKGMAFATPQLTAYGYSNDVSEMSTVASNLLLSNHSYGYLCGWYYDGSDWYWEGDINISKTEDYGFGYYDESAQMFDSIAYNSPYYLICMSAGNSRDENGPSTGGTYKYYDSSGSLKTATRTSTSNISNNDSYGTVAYTQDAKDILTIGAVSGIPLGYNNSSDVVMSSFSSWGPTDDGRIKPDLVADGVSVTSCISTSNTAYATYSGTSMASPNATGSLYLLQEYYNKLHSSFMHSSTLKALAIHTADKAGTYEGPDYQYGWGLLDVANAANVITSSYKHLTDTIIENSLTSGGVDSFTVVASGKGSLTATIVWTDPPITPISDKTVAVLDNTTPRLVNDLDMRIYQGTNTYKPWILDPSNPANAATRGDNYLDNVEKIQIDSTVAGKSYTIKITNKGTLQRGTQAFSLIISGIGGGTYCTSASTSTSGTRIDSVAFAGITNKNAAGHHNYSDFTGLTANVQANQAYPITVKVNSSDGSSATRKLKVYIDYNNNGSFYDAGELAISNSDNSINGTGGTFTGNITIPQSISIGRSSIMRIIVKDSSTVADSISACGTYANGETQDYRIQFNKPANDISVDSVVSPVAGGCAKNSQFLVVALRNNGSASQSNIPVTATITNGATTVAAYTATYSGTIAAGGVEDYVFQQPFTSVAGATYTITVSANLSTDQDTSNNTKTTNVTISGTASASTGTAEICGTSTAYLTVTDSSSSSNYLWYSSSTSTSPLGTGTSVTTSTIPSNKTYYLQSGSSISSAGPLNKATYGTGGYNEYAGNYVSYTSTVPLTLDVAKLYIGYPGKITFIVADLSDITSSGYNYTTLSSNTIDVYNTTPTATVAGSSTNPDVTADSGAYFPLNLSLPSGSHYIIIECDSATIFRNSGITSNPYPVGASNLFTITGNSATSTTNSSLYQQYYYFFYDMKLSTSDCVSAITPVPATTAKAPSISASGNHLVSSVTNAEGYQWYLGTSAISNATSDTLYPTIGGSYTVAVTDSAGCSQTSSAYTFAVTAVNNVSNSDIELKVSPNPSSTGNFTVSFTLQEATSVDIELIGSTGQILADKHYSALTGTFSDTFNTGNVANGTYILKVRAGNNVYWTKVMIFR